jgi:aspartate kinase
MTIAVKFGGTSLADAAQFRKVAAIIKADANRCVVLVSAPGKRHKQDPKVTDILLSIHETVERDRDAKPSLGLLRSRCFRPRVSACCPSSTAPARAAR